MTASQEMAAPRGGRDLLGRFLPDTVPFWALSVDYKTGIRLTSWLLGFLFFLSFSFF